MSAWSGTNAERPETIALGSIDEHLYTVHFYEFVIGKVDSARTK